MIPSARSAWIARTCLLQSRAHALPFLASLPATPRSTALRLPKPRGPLLVPENRFFRGPLLRVFRHDASQPPLNLLPSPQAQSSARLPGLDLVRSRLGAKTDAHWHTAR